MAADEQLMLVLNNLKSKLNLPMCEVLSDPRSFSSRFVASLSLRLVAMGLVTLLLVSLLLVVLRLCDGVTEWWGWCGDVVMFRRE